MEAYGKDAAAENNELLRLALSYGRMGVVRLLLAADSVRWNLDCRSGLGEYLLTVCTTKGASLPEAAALLPRYLSVIASKHAMEARAEWVSRLAPTVNLI